MTTKQDLGRTALETIAQLWQVDGSRIVDTPFGFDWWPSKFRVSVEARTTNLPEHADAWRLLIRTAFLKGVDCEDAQNIKGIALHSTASPTYAWVYTPAEVSQEYKQEIDGRVDFWTSAYVRPEMAGWLPRFIGGMAILQAIDAHRLADSLAQVLHGVPDVSGPGGGPPDASFDDMLNSGASFFVPEGRKRNPWLGSEEFAMVAERFGRSDSCFGTGDASGLTLETSVGVSTALIRLRTDAPHPVLGAGLLATLEFPFVKDEAAILDDCRWLNFFESRSWTDIPQMGSWHPRENADGQFRVSHSFFVPNGLFAPGLATNVALWQLGRARWAKKTLYPKLQDLTMEQVLKARFGERLDG